MIPRVRQLTGFWATAGPKKNNDGSVVRYLQPAHNPLDPEAKRSRVRVIDTFGREDQANRAALECLVASASRFLGPGGAFVCRTLERRVHADSGVGQGLVALDQRRSGRTTASAVGSPSSSALVISRTEH